MVGYLAKGIGSADEGIQNILDENYNPEMSLEDGEKLALNCLKQAMEKTIEKGLITMSVIPTATAQLETRDEEYIGRLLQSLPDIN
jgi:20S proteasome subunit alpha 5